MRSSFSVRFYIFTGAPMPIHRTDVFYTVAQDQILSELSRIIVNQHQHGSRPFERTIVFVASENEALSYAEHLSQRGVHAVGLDHTSNNFEQRKHVIAQVAEGDFKVLLTARNASMELFPVRATVIVNCKKIDEIEYEKRSRLFREHKTFTSFFEMWRYVPCGCLSDPLVTSSTMSDDDDGGAAV